MASGGRGSCVGSTGTAFDLFVANRLREERLLAGVSREKLGRDVGRDGEIIQAYESGKRHLSAERLATTLGALGLPLSSFFYQGPVERRRPAFSRREPRRAPGIMVTRPLKALSGSRYSEFHRLMALWKANRGAMTRDIYSDLVAGRLTRQSILLRQSARSAPLLVEQYSPGIAFVQPTEARSLLGREIGDMPDADFGEWIASIHAEAMLTGEPLFASMLADIRAPQAIVMRSRFDRLLLPWRGSSGDGFVLSLPLVRHRSVLSRAHESITDE